MKFKLNYACNLQLWYAKVRNKWFGTFPPSTPIILFSIISSCFKDFEWINGPLKILIVGKSSGGAKGSCIGKETLETGLAGAELPTI